MLWQKAVVTDLAQAMLNLIVPGAIQTYMSVHVQLNSFNPHYIITNMYLVKRENKHMNGCLAEDVSVHPVMH